MQRTFSAAQHQISWVLTCYVVASAVIAARGPAGSPRGSAGAIRGPMTGRGEIRQQLALRPVGSALGE